MVSLTPQPAASIDLNADLGESVDGFETADDESMFALISSASIACGGHAGDAASMRASVDRAQRFGVMIGAHPSYDDRAGFGRVAHAPASQDLRRTLDDQLSALVAAGADIRYVKPHGALYNTIVLDAEQAAVVAAATVRLGEILGRAIPLLGLGGEIAAAARDAGIPFLGEAFLDRGYARDGTLVPRSHPGALLEDPELVALRAVRVVRDGVIDTVDGVLIDARPASLCVHGDTPAAVEMARAVRAALDGEGIPVRAPW